jgi:hypothetical protein
LLARFFSSLLVAAALLAGVSVLPVSAQQTQLSQFDRSVFFFGGRFHSDWFGTPLEPMSLNWEDNFVVAGGYQQTVLDWHDLRLGGEFGLAGRFGSPSNTAEIWAGAFLRYDGLVIADTLRISPAFSIGLSMATGPIGIEAQRGAAIDMHEVPLLVYLGPEINVSLVGNPQWEGFVRLHHRSGAYGWIGNIDGSNAVVGGFRYKY